MLYTERLWCQDFRTAVQQLLDGAEHPQSTMKAVREHRDACANCCDFYDQLVQLSALSEDMLPPAEYEAGDGVELWKRIVKDVAKSEE